MTRDKQVWGEAAHPVFLSSLNEKEAGKVDKYSSNEDHSDTGSSGSGVTAIVVVAGILGAVCLLAVTILIVRKYHHQKKSGRELEPLVPHI
ncbi:hypothetical protein ACROYT_G011914 [Oculina patagonica]